MTTDDKTPPEAPALAGALQDIVSMAAEPMRDESAIAKGLRLETVLERAKDALETEGLPLTRLFDPRNHVG